MALTVVNMNSLLKENLMELYRGEIMEFSSKNNEDVERFLKQNSENFCKMKQAVTYFIIDYEKNQLLAYFSLALKIMEFPTESLSKSMLKILERNGNRENNSIQVPGILLAQWSKNYSYGDCISGKTMLDFVKNEIEKAQHQIGGSFMFLECEAEKTRLVEHYKNIGFSAISERVSTENQMLVQFIKKI